jgi:pimeloyl-ACP methyl ester carboxylesterase
MNLHHCLCAIGKFALNIGRNQMPNIYLEGSTVPEIGGKLKGGLAVVLHNPREVDGLIALCKLTPRPPEDPMLSVYRALSDPSLDIGAWAQHWHDLNAEKAIGATQSDNQTEWLEPFPTAPIGKMRMALQAMQNIWHIQPPDEIPELSFVLLLAEPWPKPPSLLLEGNGAALVIRPGSLACSIICPPLSVVSFAVCLVIGGGTSTSARRSGMIERLRNKAKAAPNVLPLDDITAVPPETLSSGDKDLVVLVHGLFATDVGTFGALQRALQANFKVVGYPHDTLSMSIEANAQELAQRLGQIKGKTGIFCVAHSRGGLVARWTALKLRKQSDKWISRCVTFGTPHNGAAMAENPGSITAAIALLKAACRDQSVASVLDMLCCFSEKQGYPGISDLRPASTSDTALFKLQNDEGLYADAKQPIFAVGGNASPAAILQKIAVSGIEQGPNDLIVPLTSSLPVVGPKSKKKETHCNHFGYFGLDQKAIHEEVIAFLKQADPQSPPPA